MSIPDTDFIGFSFNGIHSSELGIVRVNDGSRFNESLLPNFQDKVVPVPGGDGAYYFGSYYTQKQIPVSFAFNSLTEGQINRIKMVLGDKQTHELIFDENPYKIYKAKITGSAILKFIPFSEGQMNRVYKGEGSITFTAFWPFAVAPYKYLNQYKDYNIFIKVHIKENEYEPGKFFVYDSNQAKYVIDKTNYRVDRDYYIRKTTEWANASGMKEEQRDYDKLQEGPEGLLIPVYNAGNLESDWILSINFNSKGEIPETTISIDSENFLKLQKVTRQNDDLAIKINTKTGLIEGYRNTPVGKLIRSGNIYNQYMNMGTFFKIPISLQENGIIKDIKFKIDNSNGIKENLSNQPLEYTYYYF